jgi:hypothetical protein
LRRLTVSHSGIGAIPRTALAEGAGLPVDGGIVVDANAQDRGSGRLRSRRRSSAKSAPGARLPFHLDGASRLVAVSGVGPSALAREMRIGQIMVERDLAPDPAALADPATRLKALLQ